MEAIPNRVGDSLKKFETTFNLNRSISGHMKGQKLAQRRFSFTRNPRTVQVFERQMVLKFDTEFARVAREKPESFVEIFVRSRVNGSIRGIFHFNAGVISLMNEASSDSTSPCPFGYCLTHLLHKPIFK